jgi:hypothetical protein
MGVRILTQEEWVQKEFRITRIHGYQPTYYECFPDSCIAGVSV